MRLFQIDQVIFDLDKLTHAERLSEEQQLLLYLMDGSVLAFAGDDAETVWVILGSLACKLPSHEDVPDVPIDAQGKALDECPL